MARKKQPVLQGAPDWVLTYGDLMSLLLCFFILLSAFANFDAPNPRVEEAFDSIRKALGMRGYEGVMNNPAYDFAMLMQDLETLVRSRGAKSGEEAERKGMRGTEMTIRKIRDGAEITIGGPISFERFSAELKPDARDLLQKVAGQLVGHLNIVEVRGHATNEPLPKDLPFRDPMDLSIARARSAVNAMIEFGVTPRTLRVTGAGCNEPIQKQAYTQDTLAANRRIEIIVRESYVAEYDEEPSLSPVNSPTTQPAGT